MNQAFSVNTQEVIKIVSWQQKLHSLEINWQDGVSTDVSFLWLRDNCSTGFHPDTEERIFDLLSVSESIHPVSIKIEEDLLVVEWSEGNHQSRYPFTWLYEFARQRREKTAKVSPYQSWDQSFTDAIPSGDNDAMLQSDQALLGWMSNLNKYGLALVDNMPTTKEAMLAIANRVDYLRQTNFGVTFNVVSEKKPNNLAYTPISLPLHTDLPNQELPPGYQFLHCAKNSAEGGESTFADGLKILEDMRAEAPEHFNLLATQAIPFRFHDETHDILNYHPVINVDHAGNIVELKFNAHIADIFDLPAEIMHDYYLAYRNLMARVRDEKYGIKLKLKPGQMVVFDNRRVLHGRNAFDPSTGERQLNGCYVDRTEFQSRLRVLAKQAN